jgi:hypothetical protein
MKKFRETGLGKFLSGKGFNTVMDKVGHLVPAVGLLNDVKEMVMGSPEYNILPQQDQQLFTSLHRAEMEELDKVLADRSDARKLYGNKSEMADMIAKRVINWNLPIIFALTLLLVACTIGLKDNVLLALISSSIGYVTNQLLTERQSILAFFFSSTANSKQKTELIGKLAESSNKDNNN